MKDISKKGGIKADEKLDKQNNSSLTDDMKVALEEIKMAEAGKIKLQNSERSNK